MDRPRKRPAKKPAGDPQQQVRVILLEATPSAARFVVAALADESLTFAVRMDSAKEILSRVYGRTAPLADERDGSVIFILEGALEDYAG